MDTFTQEQLETAEGAMDSFATLPGTDPEVIAEGRPSVETMAASIESKLLIHPDINTALAASYPEDFLSEAVRALPIPINEVSKKEVPGDNNNELKRHWKKLVREMPDNATMQHIGERVVFTYPIIPDGEEEGSSGAILIVNLSGSSKKDGLMIENHFQTNPDSEVWDSSAFIPDNTQIFFRNHGLMVKIFRPFYAMGVGASIRVSDENSRKIELYRIKELENVGTTLAHEGYHIDDLPNYERTLGGYGLARVGLMGTQVLGSVAWILKNNPLYMLPHLIASLGLYGLSRDPKNMIGAGLHSLLRTESGAYVYASLLNTALENKGFILENVNSPYRRTIDQPMSKVEFAIGYEPPLWAIIDIIRMKLEEAEDPQPVPAPAYAM